MKNFLKIMTVAILLVIVTMSCQDKNVTDIVLDKATLSLTVGETETLTATVSPNDAANKAVSWTSSHPLVATVANGKVTAVKAGTATITVTTADGGFTATCTVTVTDTDEPEPEEGVLIAGVRWATCNVDAPGTFAAKPEDAGMLYQWNRKIGWSSTNPMINSDGGNTWSNLFPDATYTWEAANDPCPPGWRVPTHEEQQSLVNSGIGEWTTLNGVTGRFFGNDNQKVFFPAVGFRLGNNGELIDAGSYGIYWSSTRINTPNVHDISFNSEFVGMYTSAPITGCSVRCVKQ